VLTSYGTALRDAGALARVHVDLGAVQEVVVVGVGVARPFPTGSRLLEIGDGSGQGHLAGVVL